MGTLKAKKCYLNLTSTESFHKTVMEIKWEPIILLMSNLLAGIRAHSRWTAGKVAWMLCTGWNWMSCIVRDEVILIFLFFFFKYFLCFFNADKSMVKNFYNCLASVMRSNWITWFSCWYIPCAIYFIFVKIVKINYKQKGNINVW